MDLKEAVVKLLAELSQKETNERKSMKPCAWKKRQNSS